MFNTALLTLVEVWTGDNETLLVTFSLCMSVKMTTLVDTTFMRTTFELSLTLTSTDLSVKFRLGLFTVVDTSLVVSLTLGTSDTVMDFWFTVSVTCSSVMLSVVVTSGTTELFTFLVLLLTSLVTFDCLVEFVLLTLVGTTFKTLWTKDVALWLKTMFDTVWFVFVVSTLV